VVYVAKEDFILRGMENATEALKLTQIQGAAEVQAPLKRIKIGVPASEMVCFTDPLIARGAWKEGRSCSMRRWGLSLLRRQTRLNRITRNDDSYDNMPVLL
jgi:hypothetical protein